MLSRSSMVRALQFASTQFMIGFESVSERIPRSVLRGTLANEEHYYSLSIEATPQFTAESINDLQLFFYVKKNL